MLCFLQRFIIGCMSKRFPYTWASSTATLLQYKKSWFLHKSWFLLNQPNLKIVNICTEKRYFRKHPKIGSHFLIYTINLHLRDIYIYIYKYKNISPEKCAPLYWSRTCLVIFNDLIKDLNVKIPNDIFALRMSLWIIVTTTHDTLQSWNAG